MKGSDTFVVDTNVFVETLIQRDERHHQDSLAFLQAVRESQVKAVTTGVALVELVWILGGAYKLDKVEVVRAVSSVLGLRGLKVIDEYNYREALELYQQYKVKYIDCLMASVDKVRMKRWTLVSYDKDFDVLGMKRIESGEVMGEARKYHRS